MGFRECVSAALNDGQLTTQEADALIRRFSELEQVAEWNGPRSKGPKALLADELRSASAEKRRIAGLQQQAIEKINSDFKRAAMRNGGDIVRGAQALFENFGYDYFRSVRGIYNALLGDAHAGMAQALEAFRRSNVTLKRFNRPLLDDVVNIAFGKKGSDEARALYDAWRAAAEKLRQKFNQAGGHIGELKDWGLPQVHSDTAVLTAGFDKWRDFLAARLDWDRMTHSHTGAPILPGERDDVLKHVWDSIVSGGWNTKEPSLAPGGVALFNKRADARFLIFKDPESWRAYNTAFGTGDVVDTMMGHIRSLARDVSVMDRLGPNPNATVNWLKQLVAREGSLMKRGEPSMFPETKPALVDAKTTYAQHMIDGFYAVSLGTPAPFTRLGAGMGIFRNVELSAKMGGAVILHTFSNPVIQAMGRYLAGHPILTTALDVVKNIGRDPQDLATAGMILEDAMHTLERGAREEGALMQARELSNWLPKWTAHYSGLEAMVAANRRAAFGGQMASWAANLDRDWGQLSDRLRATLDGFGFDAEDWEMMRRASPAETDGAKMLRFQDVKDAAGERLALRYLEMLHMGTEALVPSTNWRVHAATVNVAREGTALGEVVKSAMMFKSGFMATFMLTQMQGLQRELATRGRGGTAAYAGASVIALTLAGMVSLQIKQARALKDFLPMDPDAKEGRATWERALLTSGALGIYGDFIASDHSTYGHDLLSTLAGPAVTGLEDFYHAGEGVAQNLAGGKTRTGKDAGRSPGQAIVSALRNNTPVLSTHWALSGAYNRILLDQMQYMTDPQAHQSMRRAEQRLRAETGQSHFWKPGDLLPSRAPAMTGH